MILPTKHIPAERTLLGAGAAILPALSAPRTVTALWEEVREHQAIGTFERFVLALAMLYVLGAATYESGVIARAAP